MFVTCQYHRVINTDIFTLVDVVSIVTPLLYWGQLRLQWVIRYYTLYPPPAFINILKLKLTCWQHLHLSEFTFRVLEMGDSTLVSGDIDFSTSHAKYMLFPFYISLFPKTSAACHLKQVLPSFHCKPIFCYRVIILA
jgi:hypothetical protein